MFEALLILIFGLAPSLFSIWVIRQSDARTQARLQLAIQTFNRRSLPNLRSNPDLHYVEGVGLMLGDLTCVYNARSTYIRCAVNPSGPCQECSHYQSRDMGHESEAIRTWT